MAAVLVLVGVSVAGVVVASAQAGPVYGGVTVETPGGGSGLAVAWIESAQPPDWEALRAEADRQRQQGAAGGAGGEQQTPSDRVPDAPPLVLPRPHWPSYEWKDGDRTLEVFLDRSMEMTPDGDGFRFQTRAGGAGGAGGAVGASSSGYPVFRSASGGLMALPGGVILVLDPEWDAAAVEAFLVRNGVADAVGMVLDFVANGFVIDTEPGFSALTLSNHLAAQDGVEIAQPNWLVEQALH